MEQKKGSALQTGLMIFFGVGAVLGFLIFADFIPLKSKSRSANTPTGNVTIWGTVQSLEINNAIQAIQGSARNLFITYQQIPSEQFNNRLVDALAAGRGPDIIIFPSQETYFLSDKLFPIPYTSLPEATFRERFLETGEMFLMPEGIIALPLMVDPLVMYYNRDILASSFITQVPEFWDEWISLVPKIVKKTESGILEQNAFALGTFNNISHPSVIFETLLLQLGTRIAEKDTTDNRWQVTAQNPINSIVPLSTAGAFYAQFARPDTVSYSWSPSLPNDRMQFISNKLAVYFGFASEASLLRRENPNLNFDIALFPQIRNTRKVTYGTMLGIAVTNQSKNIPASVYVLSTLAGDSNFIQKFALENSGAPALRSVTNALLAESVNNRLQTITLQSAIIAKNWMNPSPVNVRSVWDTYVRSLVSGSENILDATGRTVRGIEALYQR